MSDNATVATTTLSAEQLCLEKRSWYAFLCSSLITFFVGLLFVLTWRIFAWLCCQSGPGGRGGAAVAANAAAATKPGTPTKTNAVSKHALLYETYLFLY